MYTLFGRPGSGSLVCEVLLARSGAPHEIVDLEKAPDGSPTAQLRELNPLGQVPVLVLPDGRRMTESAAITQFLGARFPETGLAPAEADDDWPIYLRWLAYLATAIYMTELRLFYGPRYTTDPEGGKGVAAAA